MAKQYIFVDGMDSITLSDGLIKMELFNIENPTADEGADAVHDKSTQLIMTPKSFLRSFEAMENLISQLADAGLISRKNDEKKQNAPQSGFSPNFM